MIATLDASLGPRRRPRRPCRAGRREGQRSVWPVAVVMLHEDVEDPLEMLGVQDQQPVETLGPNGAHEPLRDTVRLRRPKRCANDLEPTASQHVVKAGSVFLVPVANQEAERFWAFGQSP